VVMNRNFLWGFPAEYVLLISGRCASTAEGLERLLSAGHCDEGDQSCIQVRAELTTLAASLRHFAELSEKALLK
jgi:hypothetical protein